MADFNFTTGPAPLPDVGSLSYNGCTFSPLFESSLSGNPAKDNAKRTVKYMEYVLEVDGYVTLPAQDTSIDLTMEKLRTLLSVQAGDLNYEGRGFILQVNAASGDVAWGPVPELLDFQPLGSGRSAKVQWKVKVCITEPPFARISSVTGQNLPLLQFNYETSVIYGDDGYSALSMSGTMEIPMTRSSQKTRTLKVTVDDLRLRIETRLMSGIDLSRFRVARREFKVSRDKRTLEWDWLCEETPYMKMPEGCTVARGTYNVRPAKVGMGLALWLCTLRATYTVRADMPRRVAWLSFLALLRLRMAASEHGSVPDAAEPPLIKPDFSPVGFIGFPLELIGNLAKRLTKKKTPEAKVKAWIIDFSFDEGLYLDSKTTSFSATWRLVTSFSHILLASGLWKKVEEGKGEKSLWAMSMKDISGARSWLPNTLDPSLDVIVDFGGG